MSMAGAPPSPLPEPLRLPRGSVRGLLAVLLTATFGYLLLQKTAVLSVLVNAVVVVIAFYFGSGASRAAYAPGRPAAGQPSGRIPIPRILLLLGFAGLAAWFLQANPTLRALPPELLEILEVLGGYVLGLSLSWIFHRRVSESALRRRLATAFRDVSAAGSLGLTGYVCYAFATGQQGVLAGQAEQLLSLVITYYFGSRVVGR